VSTLRAKVSDGADERGLAEFVVVFPAFFLVVILVVEVALWQHAAHVARAAADQGVASAAAVGSSLAAGRAAAIRFVDDTGPGALSDMAVSATALSGGKVAVTVSGRPQLLIPWFDPVVSATSVEQDQIYASAG
jgi:Flp pilus assembly protein TadG